MTPLVRRLLILWVAIWLASFLLGLFDVPLADWFALSPGALFDGEITALPGLVLYAFVHEPNSILHLLFNAWILAFAGPEVERLWPQRRFLRFLTVVVISGALVHLMLAALIPSAFRVPVIGGSGFVLACLAAMTALYPHLRINLFLIQVRLLPVFLVLVALDLLRMTAFLAGKGGPVAADVHLAGAAAGWAWAGGFARFGPLRRWSEKRQARRQDRQARRTAHKESELNRILDKINDHGMPSLTKKERQFLERRSRQMRSRD